MKQIAFVVIAAVNLIAADVTGNWSGTLTTPRPDGSTREGPALLVLKQEGSKVTGTAGPDADERHNIENGRIEAGNLTFQVPSGNNVMSFVLKHEGDEIKGEVSRERDGEKQTAKLAVKREK